MKKKELLIAASVFLASALSYGSLFASTTCKVVSVQEDNVTLDCGDDASDYSPGMKVKVKASKARAAIEGC
jgi:hypothetical protein